LFPKPLLNGSLFGCVDESNPSKPGYCIESNGDIGGAKFFELGVEVNDVVLKGLGCNDEGKPLKVLCMFDIKSVPIAS
jgi:hypothetical protein